MPAEVPIWLLDIDGVLNVTKPGWSAPPRTKTAYADGTPWKMRFSPVLIDHIRELHASGAVEIRLCSTWCGWPDGLRGEGRRVRQMHTTRRPGCSLFDHVPAKLARHESVLLSAPRTARSERRPRTA